MLNLVALFFYAYFQRERKVIAFGVYSFCSVAGHVGISSVFDLGGKVSINICITLVQRWQITDIIRKFASGSGKSAFQCGTEADDSP